MRIPVPLNALRAFEAAARHGSIKAAADELGVTPSAVSHRVRALEEAVGLDLLRRAGAGVEATAAGRALAPALTAGLGRIAAGVAALTEDRKAGPLRLSMLPTFAVHWLSPRLAAYPFEKADSALLISATQEAVDLAAGIADAAVRHGSGDWPGLDADLLFEETVTLFAAPGFVSGAEGVGADASGLRRAVAGANLFLSQHRRGDFEAWNASLSGGPLRPAAVTIVDSAGLGLRAAIDGAGVTLAGVEIAAADLDAGRLVAPFAHRTATAGAYHLVYRPALRRDPRLKRLRDWLLDQVQRSPSQ
ncbi:MAG: LysR substrate-binding domain-containing protein [Alphaproteobacteria bacterium]